ncbi:MAG: hypothetical protein Phog2KO_43510 [Phototrophicaceae bacterium]
MRIQYKFVLLLLSTLLLSLPVSAQPPTAFQAMLYDSANGELIVVDNLGAVIDQDTLPSLGVQTFSDNIHVSESGIFVAYVLTDTNSNAKDLMIYNRLQNTIIDTYRIPANPTDEVYHSLTFGTRGSAFDVSETSFAFGMVVANEWRMVVIDLLSNNPNVSAELTALTANFPFSLPDNVGILPIPRQFDGQYLDFAMQVIAVGGSSEIPAFRWDTANIDPNTNIVQNPIFRNMASDFTSLTYEHVLTVPDKRIISDAELSYSVHIATANYSDNGNTFPIYSSPDYNYTSPTFIQNGNRIALLRMPPMGVEGDTAWEVIERTGIPVGTLGLGTLIFAEMEGVVDGFIYSAEASHINEATNYNPSPDTPATALMYVNTTNSFADTAGDLIWLSDDNTFPELVWVQNSPPAIPPQGGWTALLPTTMNACDYSRVFCSSTPLTIGSLVAVSGSGADIRSGAGQAFAIIAQLVNGDTVTVLEGPITVDGLTWWRVQTSTNVTGWIADDGNTFTSATPEAVSTATPIVITATPAPVTAVPTVAPTASDALAGFPFAQVTVEGNNLNARTSPTTGASVLAILSSGDTFPIVGGPVQADGFTWWQLNTPDGNAWAADGIGNIRWLRGLNALPPTAIPPTGVPPTGVPPTAIPPTATAVPPVGTPLVVIPLTPLVILTPLVVEPDITLLLIKYSGTVDVQQTFSLNLDNGTSSGGVDLFYQAENSTSKFLAPRNGAVFSMQGFAQPGIATCQSASYTNGQRFSFNDITAGRYFCYRTSEGDHGYFRVNDDLSDPESVNSVSLTVNTWDDN